MQEYVEDLNLIEYEIERRKSGFYTYNTGKTKHSKQIGFHQDIHKSRWVFGGNRTGKTECGAIEAIYWATGLHPYRDIKKSTDGWVVSLSLQVQRDVAQAKILKYLSPEFIVDVVMRSGKSENPKNGVIDFISVRNKFGGISKIGFKSCDQGREKFQGTSLDWVWFDEEPPEDIYEECLLRTLDRGGIVWGTMTPLKGRNWLYNTIYLDSDRHSIHQMSWDDNPFLLPDEIYEMEKRLSQDALESRKYGRFTCGEGLVFPEFGDENIIDPIPMQEFIGYNFLIAIDPAYVAPTGVIWVATNGEDYVVIHDYSVSHKTVAEHAQAILDKTKQLGITEYTVLIDNSSLQRTLVGRDTVEQQFKDNGLDVNASINKNVMESIMKMKTLLKDVNGVRRLFITRNCINLVREIRGYYWGDNDRPVKKNDHCIDALRYVVMHDLNSGKKAKQNILGEKKSELLKMAKRNL
ncbi:MAG: terminase family protein [Firmicutes bacterium]|nr:terminase family protein [Bacillota bacterium]